MSLVVPFPVRSTRLSLPQYKPKPRSVLLFHLCRAKWGSGRGGGGCMKGRLGLPRVRTRLAVEGWLCCSECWGKNVVNIKNLSSRKRAVPSPIRSFCPCVCCWPAEPLRLEAVLAVASFEPVSNRAVLPILFAHSFENSLPPPFPFNNRH